MYLFKGYLDTFIYDKKIKCLELYVSRMMQFYTCNEHHKKTTSLHFQFCNNSSQSTYFVIHHTITKASKVKESWTITAFIISAVWVNFSKALHLFSFDFNFLTIILQ